MLAIFHLRTLTCWRLKVFQWIWVLHLLSSHLTLAQITLGRFNSSLAHQCRLQRRFLAPPLSSRKTINIRYILTVKTNLSSQQLWATTRTSITTTPVQRLLHAIGKLALPLSHICQFSGHQWKSYDVIFFL